MDTSLNFDYANELMRISSFSTSLNHFLNHSVLTLARDGFYNLSEQSKIKCYSCGYTYDFTTEKGDPIANHRRESPSCDHIRRQSPSYGASTFQQSHGILESRISPPNARYTTNDTASVRSQNSTTKSAQALSDFRLEYCRRESFHGWPSSVPISPDDLANAGFYYLGTDDKVQCAFCKGILRSWEPDDRPLAEHLRHFPTCEFLLNPLSVGNVPLGEEDQSMLATNAVEPVHPYFTQLSERLDTIPTLPFNTAVSPMDVAKAGFFFTGDTNTFRCFFCDVELSFSEIRRDPRHEHSKVNPACIYLSQTNGPDSFAGKSMKGKNLRSKQRKRPINEGSGSAGTIHLKKLEEMTTTIQTVFDMGYSYESILRVVAKRLQLLGTSFPNVDSLVDALEAGDDPWPKRKKGSAGTIDLKQLEEMTPTIQTVLDMGYSYESILRVVAKRLQLFGTSFPNVDSLIDALEAGDDQSTLPKRKKDQDTEDHPTEEEERVVLENQFFCKVCLDNAATIVFLHCGHLVCCEECAKQLSECPICRQNIVGTIKIKE